MAVVCTPTVYVDGSPIQTAGGTVTAVGELSVTWGRSALLDRATPATATVTVRDTALGAPLAARDDLIGRQVILGWVGSDASTGVLFRGRVTDAAVTYRRRRGGYEVTLSCSSLEVDAGNHRADAGTTWPAETVQARYQRISALAPAELYAPTLLPSRLDVGLTDVADPSRDFGSYLCSPAEVGGRNMLELLHALYESLYPVPLIYDPARNGFGWASRRRYVYTPEGAAHSGRLVADPTRGGRYVGATVNGAPGLTLDAEDLAYEGELLYPLESRVTRVDIDYASSTGVKGTARALIDGGGGEPIIGRRPLTIQSMLSEPAMATQLASSWALLAQNETRRPRLGTLNYSTARAPFPTAGHASALLRGCESGAQLFIGRSWATALDVRPIYGILGESITYAGGQWSIDFQPAPVSVEWPTAPITSVGAASGTAVRLVDVDESVTVADLAFIDVGAGFTTATQPL